MRAGLVDLVYLHEVRCFSCRADVSYRAEIGRDGPCPHCGSRDRSKVFSPNWGSARYPDEVRVMRTIANSDVVMRIGSRLSLTAAIMERQGSQTGTPKLVLNPSDDGRDPDVETRLRPLDTIVPVWAAEVLARPLVRDSA